MARQSNKNIDMRLYDNFSEAIYSCLDLLKVSGQLINPNRWQGIPNNNPMWEMLYQSFIVKDIPDDLRQLAQQIKPNLPWADDHFKERVSGKPLNPGEQYKNWPPYKRNPANDKFRTEANQFSHTYMERYWPKHAGNKQGYTNFGIRYEYGDLGEMIKLLLDDPLTRQAYLPVWFPEDTGATHGRRVPCSLGYWVVNRNDDLNITYYIRSCDAKRHFRDDIYLTVRLLHYILEVLKQSTYPYDDVEHPYWKNVKLGTFTMHIGSFHIFAKEKNLL